MDFLVYNMLVQLNLSLIKLAFSSRGIVLVLFMRRNNTHLNSTSILLESDCIQVNVFMNLYGVHLFIITEAC